MNVNKVVKKLEKFLRKHDVTLQGDYDGNINLITGNCDKKLGYWPDFPWSEEFIPYE